MPVSSEEPSRSSFLPTDSFRDLLFIALLWIAACLILRPLQNTPFLDDWIYAWRVHWLLDHGQLRTLQYSSNPNFVQVLWGALFCLPFGFSFTALRLSTAVLAVAATWGQYLLLRELGVPRRDSWIGTAVLGCNPVFFLLAFTFMTEVPFLCVLLWAIYTFVRAIRAESVGMLLVSIALACLSAGIRVVGVAVPFAASLTLLFHPGGWGRRRLRFLYPLIAPAVAGAFLWLALAGRAQRTIPLEQWQSFWWVLPGILPYIGTCVGLWLLPLSIDVFDRRHLSLTAAFLIPLTALLAWFMIYRIQTYTFPVTTETWPVPSDSWPLFPDSFWSLGELGASQREVPGYQATDFPVSAAWAVGMLGMVSFAGVLTAAWRRRESSPERLLLWTSAGFLVLIALLLLVFDRYALPLLPLAIALVLSGRSLRRPALATALTALLTLTSLVGVRDHLHYNRAVWEGVDQLRRSGAADSEIHGGYVVDGWLRRDGLHQDDPAAARYEIAGSPQPGMRVLGTVPYTRWFGSSGSIYLLERDADAPAQAPVQ